MGHPLCPGMKVTGKLWGRRDLCDASIYSLGLSPLKSLAEENVYSVRASSRDEGLPLSHPLTRPTVKVHSDKTCTWQCQMRTHWFNDCVHTAWCRIKNQNLLSFSTRHRVAPHPAWTHLSGSFTTDAPLCIAVAPQYALICHLVRNITTKNPTMRQSEPQWACTMAQHKPTDHGTPINWTS